MDWSDFELDEEIRRTEDHEEEVCRRFTRAYLSSYEENQRYLLEAEVALQREDYYFVNGILRSLGF